ncbi:MAG: hypothetical protein GXP60_01090 [Epsilonproteobacteria bacterium]|nr:hypothetical protein [Campylobacterota bacterium]
MKLLIYKANKKGLLISEFINERERNAYIDLIRDDCRNSEEDVTIPIQDCNYINKNRLKSDYDIIFITDDFYFKNPGHELLKIERENCFVIVASSGLMNEFYAAGVFGRQRTVSAVYDEVKKVIYFGSLDENGVYADRAANLFGKSGIKALSLTRTEISRKKWEMILIDSVLMLFAVSGRKTVMMNYEIKLEIKSLISEIVAVVETSHIVDFSFRDYVEQFEKNILDLNWLSQYELRLREENLKSKFSLLNGYIAELGRRYAVKTPINRNLSLISSMS